MIRRSFLSRDRSDLLAWVLLLPLAMGVSGCDVLLGTNGERFEAECLPAERRCVANQPQSCGEDLFWQDLNPCSETQPVCVEGICSAVHEVAAGAQHSCAIVGHERSVRCWGRNTYGELGDGTTNNAVVPVDVEGLRGVEQIALGGHDDGAHSCALLEDRRVACWGANTQRQVGGLQDPQTRPRIVDGVEDVRFISVGARHTCAALGDGSAKCWGWTILENWPEPTEVFRLSGESIVSVAAGGAHVCGLTDKGHVYCRGHNRDGQCGPTPELGTLNPALPAQVPGIVGATSLAAGQYHTCALMSHEIWCWGANDCGQLGRGTVCGTKCTMGNVYGCGDPLPAQATLDAGGFKLIQMDVGTYHSCALSEIGTLFCVGRNDFSQASPNAIPVPDHGGSNAAACTADFAKTQFFNVRQMSAGTYHNCVLEQGGLVKCWGRNDYGQLGYPVAVQW